MIGPNVEITDGWLLSLLRNGEDHMAERKPMNKSWEEWVRAVVAFANSMPVGYPGVLFVGVDKKGNMTEPVGTDLDSFQRDTFLPQMKRIYPRVFCVPRILSGEDGRQCLAVIVPGSNNRPHFAGHSFVRVGSESREADEEQFQALVAERSSKGCTT